MDDDLIDDIIRGAVTYTLTDNPWLGAADAIWGEDADENTKVAVIKDALEASYGTDITNLSQQQLESAISSIDQTQLTESVSRVESGQSSFSATTGTTQENVTGTTTSDQQTNQQTTGTADTDTVSRETSNQTGTTTADTTGTQVTDSARTETGEQTSTGTQESETGTGAFTGTTGLGTAAYDPATGAFSTALADPYQQQVDQALAASTGAYGALSGMDFDTTMAQRYNALEALQEQDRLQAQLDMESRLYSQGRLGSTGGALQQNSLMDAIAQQQAQNANTAFTQAMGYQDQNAQLAQQFAQAGLAPQSMAINQATAFGALAPQISSSTSNQTMTNQDIINAITTAQNEGRQVTQQDIQNATDARVNSSQTTGSNATTGTTANTTSNQTANTMSDQSTTANTTGYQDTSSAQSSNLAQLNQSQSEALTDSTSQQDTESLNFGSQTGFQATGPDVTPFPSVTGAFTGTDPATAPAPTTVVSTPTGALTVNPVPISSPANPASVLDLVNPFVSGGLQWDVNDPQPTAAPTPPVNYGTTGRTTNPYVPPPQDQWPDEMLTIQPVNPPGGVPVGMLQPNPADYT